MQCLSGSTTLMSKLCVQSMSMSEIWKTPNIETCQIRSDGLEINFTDEIGCKRIKFDQIRSKPDQGDQIRSILNIRI